MGELKLEEKLLEEAMAVEGVELEDGLIYQ